jgi:maltooligosyltrehalose trehalohydrolase
MKRAPVRRVVSRSPSVATWSPTLGAVPVDGGARFAVWAPRATRVDIAFEYPGFTVTRPLSANRDGTFTGWEPDLPNGTRYRFRLDGGRELPDPASRWQPEGVHGPSAYVDPTQFVWTDSDWGGLSRDALIIYELHVGTFTPEGTFAGVESKLGYLASLGVTAVELMPVAEAAGCRNWGYDGVDLFAPSHHYGTPDDLRRLVNAAHAHGLGVILDVVYNHLGPDGAYLSAFSDQYFTERHASPWGAAVNLDGEGSEHVRTFFIENALHWLNEYHVDGLRLDATHTLMDEGERHFLAELSERVRAGASRPVLLIAEDERNLATLVQAPPRGYGLDAVWADDFHHQIRRAIAGDHEGYFADFSGSAPDIVATIRRGWFYVGQPTPTAQERRGSDPSGLSPSQFIVCLQNHDQVGNRAFGDRLNHGVDIATFRAASALLLLLPQTPMLFMGQEWAASSPFLYFTDHEPKLGRLITEGRRNEFAAFSAFGDAVTRTQIPDPQDPSTFHLSRLVWGEQELPAHAGVQRLYRALLGLRRGEAALRDPRTPFDVFAANADTIVLQRGQWILVVRLSGSGAVELPSSTVERVLTTEDGEFAAEGRPPQLRFEATRPVVQFSGPAAILLKRT